MVEVCFALAGAFFLLAIHTYTFYPITLALMPRRRLKAAAPGWRRPTVAICMSAFNEERVIVAKIEGLIALATAYGPARVHVFVDGATDRTAELLEPYKDQINIVVSAERRGKTAGVKLLAAQTDTELLAFTDANVAVRPIA